MYTEDDEKVKVKKNNSKDDYNDFYTTFAESDEEESKSKKSSNKKDNNKKKEEKSEPKEEIDYSAFYDENDDSSIDSNSIVDKKVIIKYCVIALLLIILIVLIVVLFKGCSKNKVIGDIELNNSNISLIPGGSDYISYKVVNTDSKISSSFVSSNTKVATVDENGKVVAVSEGESTITIYYTVDGVNKEKKCTVKVSSSTPAPTQAPQVDETLTLTLKYVQGSENSWTNKDVIINVETKTSLGLSSLKYATNCSGTCNYVDVTNNKITISNNGTTKITVKAVDKKNKEVIKETTVKIDKESPNATYTGEKNITSNNDVEVCATCTDGISGCKKDKVCKKYTSSASNQTITVTDNAGNTKKSSTFNVTITKKQDPCTLSVSSDGTVKATLRESAKYYGFNSSYSGSNELSKKVNIANVTKNGDSGAMVVKYYVLNKNGSGGMCYVTVIKECKCTNSTSTNCQATCTFRAN